MVGRSLFPEATMDDAVSYLIAVRNTFRDDEPEYQEFLILFRDFGARRLDTATVVARMEELMKDHLNLLLGLNTFLPAEFRRTIPPKARKEFDQNSICGWKKRTTEAYHR
ncbi:unnamed protein product [Arabidopsis halleri]